MADWQAIKTEYITSTSGTSYRKLAKKYGVSYVQIGNVGKEENWVELRRQHLDSVLTKSLAADTKKKVDRAKGSEMRQIGFWIKWKRQLMSWIYKW